MSELTLTIIRLGLLVLLWVFVFSVVGVLRGDLYGTRVVSRRAAAAQPRRSARPPHLRAAKAADDRPSRSRRRGAAKRPELAHRHRGPAGRHEPAAARGPAP